MTEKYPEVKLYLAHFKEIYKNKNYVDPVVSAHGDTVRIVWHNESTGEYFRLHIDEKYCVTYDNFWFITTYWKGMFDAESIMRCTQKQLDKFYGIIND